MLVLLPAEIINYRIRSDSTCVSALCLRLCDRFQANSRLFNLLSEPIRAPTRSIDRSIDWPITDQSIIGSRSASALHSYRSLVRRTHSNCSPSCLLLALISAPLIRLLLAMLLLLLLLCFFLVSVVWMRFCCLVLRLILGKSEQSIRRLLWSLCERIGLFKF